MGNPVSAPTRNPGTEFQASRDHKKTYHKTQNRRVFPESSEDRFKKERRRPFPVCAVAAQQVLKVVGATGVLRGKV